MTKICRSIFLPSPSLSIGLLLCSLTGLLACGGGGGSSSSDSSGVKYTLAQVDQTLTQRMGENNSVAALLLAINEGYSVSQISDAIMQDRLEISGEIVNSNGQVLNPTYSPLGIIEEQARMLAESGGYDLASLVSLCRSVGGNIGQTGVFVLLALLNHGYSAQQIIDALILNDIKVIGQDAYIEDAIGNFLLPDRSADAGSLEDNNSTPPPPSSPNPPSSTPPGTLHVVVSGQGVVNCRADIRYNITIADDDEEYECENLAVGEACEAEILSTHRTVFVSYTASGLSYSHEYTYLPTTQTNIELPCIGGPGETSGGW